MSFAAPLWLLALALVPGALAAHSLARRRARRYAVRFTAVSTLRVAAGTTPAWRRAVPMTLSLAAIGALGVALARPQLTYRTPVNAASIMLVSDHSGSMAATDVQPTRLLAAERAADTFISRMPAGVRVGAIAFSSSPDAVQAPSTTHADARGIIDGQVASGATATGPALALALQLLHGADAKHPPSAIVLLSDGAANAGANPLMVARQAARDRIPIYTVALGTPDGILPNPDPFGAPIPVPPDPQLMQQIAAASSGRSFSAQTADQLNVIYRRLGSQLGSISRKREITYGFAAGGLLLLAAAALTSVRWLGRLP